MISLTKEYINSVKKISMLDIVNQYNISVYEAEVIIKSLGITKINKRIDLSGCTLGEVKIISDIIIYYKKRKERQWICHCSCGKQFNASRRDLFRHSISKCRACKRWTGYKEISGTVFSTIRNNAENRNFVFDITIEYIWELFLKQNRKCALSGLDLVFCRHSSSKRTASLDRIDSSIGYVEGNVQWVHKKVNKMKMELKDDFFVQSCKEISLNEIKNNPEKCEEKILFYQDIIHKLEKDINVLETCFEELYNITFELRLEKYDLYRQLKQIKQ